MAITEAQKQDVPEGQAAANNADLIARMELAKRSLPNGGWLDTHAELIGEAQATITAQAEINAALRKILRAALALIEGRGDEK